MTATSSSNPHHSRPRLLSTSSETSPEDGGDTMKPQHDCCKEATPSSNGHAEQPESVVVRYTECRKNHAARIGGYAVDGCREFMAGGEEGTGAALRCAACGCHRSFHRREVVERVPRAPWDWDCGSNSSSPR